MLEPLICIGLIGLALIGIGIVMHFQQEHDPEDGTQWFDVPADPED